MEHPGILGHDWIQAERRINQDHLVLYICSKCRCIKRAAGDDGFPTRSLKVLAYSPYTLTSSNEPLTCEEAQVWMIQSQ